MSTNRSFLLATHEGRVRTREHALAPNADGRATATDVAETLCAIWDRERDFGFLLDWETGRVLYHGSTSGALLPAALALAYDYFSERRFLDTALAVAAYYRDHDTSPGPSPPAAPEMLCKPPTANPSSPSSRASSRSTTHRRPRLARGRRARLSPGRVVGHLLTLPISTRLRARPARHGRLWRQTANAQNKCGVPGICTLSGQGVLRAYRATGDTALLDFLREIAHSIPQYLSREDRRIPTRITWGHPLPELPPGWMCERVNITPSWPEPLGEQAAYSCWCEVALMLTWADLPDIYWDTTANRACALDHVEAEVIEQGCALRITNPTPYPARVRILAEDAAARARPLPANAAATWPIAHLAAQSAISYPRDS